MAAELGGRILDFAMTAVPIPYLDTSFSILAALHASIQNVRGIRAQMTTLTATVDELLCLLNTKLQGMDHLEQSIESSLQDFNSLLIDISETAEKFSKHSFLKIFFTRTDVQGLIDQHHRKMSEMLRSFQMQLQITTHNDIRRFEEARQKDHKDVLGVIRSLQTECQFSQAANEAMKDEFPLTKKEIEDYSSTVHVASDERDIIDTMLKYLNRSSVLAPPHYQKQYGPTAPPSYYYSEEPAAMSEAESQIAPNRLYSARRPVYRPVYSTYPPYYPPSTPPHGSRTGMNHSNDRQPYHPVGHNATSMQMPIPHHYPARAEDFTFIA